MKKAFILFTVLLTFIGLLAGCGNSKTSGAGEKIIIGYFPNINHVPMMVAKEKGFLEEQLGDGTTIEYKTFPDGSSFMTALKTGEIHAGLVGPGPAMNNYSTGADVRIIAGASTGGTVVLASKQSGIESVEDFAGKSFVTPAVGCTHDVQVETFLKDLGITSERIGGTMRHLTGNPATYEALLETGKVDIAVAPEPWAATLQLNTGAKVIINWDEIAWGKTLPASVLVTSGKLIDENNDLIKKIVAAHKEATEFIAENAEEAKEITIKDIKAVTGEELSKEVIDLAWERIGFTYEVDEEAVQSFADSSHDLKFLKEKPDFSKLIDDQFIQ